MFEALKDRGFQIALLSHAEAILLHDMRAAADDVEAVLVEARLPIEELIRGGGGEGGLTQRLRRAFEERGWKKHNFEIKKVVDGIERESISHEVDHVKRLETGTVALEIEWNNKDPFFDRDLENFKRLHSEGAISMGVIITRGKSLQTDMRSLVARFARARGIDSIEAASAYYSPTGRQKSIVDRAIAQLRPFPEAWANQFVSDKFGEATTHWTKLQQRVRRGVGSPCPLVLVGLPSTIIEGTS